MIMNRTHQVSRSLTKVLVGNKIYFIIYILSRILETKGAEAKPLRSLDIKDDPRSPDMPQNLPKSKMGKPTG